MTFWRPVFVLMLLPEEVWNTAATESAENWWLLHTMRLCHSVALRGLPLGGRVAVDLKSFHFAILTADSEICGREEI